jgi:hypothetical protein
VNSPTSIFGEVTSGFRKTVFFSWSSIISGQWTLIGSGIVLMNTPSSDRAAQDGHRTQLAGGLDRRPQGDFKVGLICRRARHDGDDA